LEHQSKETREKQVTIDPIYNPKNPQFSHFFFVFPLDIGVVLNGWEDSIFILFYYFIFIFIFILKTLTLNACFRFGFVNGEVCSFGQISQVIFSEDSI
jgi:hypothetical protein